MKKVSGIILLFAIFLSGKVFAQDDTVGFWKIEYNRKEITPVTMNAEETYYISAISDSGLLNVFYYTESPCKTCPCKLELRNENAQVLKTIERKGYGDNRPFQFTGKEIEAMLAKGRVYLYFSGKYDDWLPWVFMGTIKKLP